MAINEPVYLSPFHPLKYLHVLRLPVCLIRLEVMSVAVFIMLSSLSILSVILLALVNFVVLASL